MTHCRSRDSYQLRQNDGSTRSTDCRTLRATRGRVGPRPSEYQWNDRIWHDRFTGRLRSGTKVLDLGCGSGRPVGEHMAKQGLRVTGVDASPTMISLCRERLPAPRMDYCRYARLALSQRFDGILAWDSFFHLDHVDQRQMFPVFEHHGSGG